MDSQLQELKVTDELFTRILMSNRSVYVDRYASDDVVYVWVDGFIMSYMTKHYYDAFVVDFLDKNPLFKGLL